MLLLSIAARNSGKRPSELAGVTDEFAALDFDVACTVRLNHYDADCREQQAILIAAKVGELFGGRSES